MKKEVLLNAFSIEQKSWMRHLKTFTSILYHRSPVTTRNKQCKILGNELLPNEDKARKV